MKEIFFEKLTETFNKYNINLSQEQKQKFFDYYNLLIDWNNKFNLTAITEMEDVIKKHFLDSCICEKLLKSNAKIIDIGAGAGFPSLPLKILRPDLSVLMVDSVNKKVCFLQEIIRALKINDVSTIHSRAEDLAKSNVYREQFDYSVSRAVASLNTLAEYCLPFVKIGGEMIAYKSSEIEEEINISKKAISILGGKIQEVLSKEVEDVTRKFVAIKKVNSSPLKYPRGANKPRLMPL